MRHHLLFAFLLLLAGAASSARATDDFFTFTFEDDFFAGRDFGYTGGTQLDWARGPGATFDDVAPHWIAAMASPLWLAKDPDKLRAVSYKVGLAIFTPLDIEDPVPPKDDLPYSGLLYFQTTWHAFDERVADSAYLMLGLVGHDSGAEWAQKTFHRIIGSQKPEGWNSQLDDEPVIKIGIGRKWRTGAWDFDDSAWGTDLITTTELGLGTFDSNADLGLTLRLGKNLLRSFPTAGLLPGREINPLAGQPVVDFNFFLALLARYQPNAMYIEGNNFGGKQTDLTLRREQYFFSGGVSWNIGDWGFQYALARSTKLFDEAHASQTFGSLSVTYRY